MHRGYLNRRGLLVGSLLVLGGCGFRPVYAPRADGTAGAAEQGLAEISVGIIPERLGQILRQSLQTRFDRSGVGAAKRYDLVATIGLAGEALNIEQATSVPSRLRLVGISSWSLIAQDTRRRTLTNGTARVLDGFNLYDQQYFAMDSQNEAVQRRIAEALAEQITLQLAVWFNRKAATE